MSGEKSQPTDCSEVLDRLYEYLDREMPDGDCEKFREHIDECSPCLAEYGLEQSVKKLVKRCCGHDEVPAGLREKVLGRIDAIRAGECDGAPAAPPPASPASRPASPSSPPSPPPSSSPAAPAD